MEMEESSSLSFVALGGQVYRVWGKVPGFLYFMLFWETQRMPDATMDTVMSTDFYVKQCTDVNVWKPFLWIKNILILLWGNICAIKQNLIVKNDGIVMNWKYKKLRTRVIQS